MLTRVRFEASAKTRDGVIDELVGAVALVRETYGGEWEECSGGEGVQQNVIPAKDGFWGHMCIENKEKRHGST